jgi:hypothetical protein
LPDSTVVAVRGTDAPDSDPLQRTRQGGGMIVAKL